MITLIYPITLISALVLANEIFDVVVNAKCDPNVLRYSFGALMICVSILILFS